MNGMTKVYSLLIIISLCLIANGGVCGDSGHPVPVGDVNGDCVVDAEDFVILANHWLKNLSSEIEAYQVDNLGRFFPDQKPERLSDNFMYHLPKGAKAVFQFAITHTENITVNLSVTNIKNTNTNAGVDIPSSLYDMVSIPVEANSNGCSITAVGTIPNASWNPYFVRMAPFEMAEAVKPAEILSIQTGRYSSALVELDIPENTPAGTYRGFLEVSGYAESKFVPFEFTVHKTTIPSGEFLLETNHWLSSRPQDLCRSNPPAWWSEQHWQLLENTGRAIRAYGDCGVMTPLVYGGAYPLLSVTKLTSGRYSFDFTKFNRWAEMFFGLGFTYLEGAHLFRRDNGMPIESIYGYNQANGYFMPLITASVSTAEWNIFIQDFGTAMYAHLQQKGWTNKYRQHLMDEPGDAAILANAYNLIKSVMPGVETLDAIHSWGQDPAGFSPYTDVYIFSVELLPDNQTLLTQRTAQGRKNWMYYFCKPYPPKPNRSLDMALTNSRLYPILCYKYNADGMIFWAANQYRGANPYTSSIGPLPNGSQNPGHPVGDCWLFYPTNSGLIGSARMIAFRDGLIDHLLISTLAGYNQTKADQLVGGVVNSLTDYQRTPSAYHELRKSLLIELDKY